MSHRRHRLIRGRVDRKGILQQVARELDRGTEDLKRQKEAQKERVFNSVKEALHALRSAPWKK